MSIAKMQKIRIVGIKRQRRHVLDLLQDVGLIQIEPPLEEQAELDRELDYDAVLSELEFSIDYLEKFENVKKSFFEALVPERKVLSYFDVKNRVLSFDFQKTVKECREVESELMNLDELMKNILHEREMLASWTGLNFTLDELVNSKRVTYFTGALPLGKSEELKSALEDLPAEFQVVGEIKTGILLLVATEKDRSEDVYKALTEIGFSETKLPISSRTPAEELEKIKYSLIEEEARREDVKNRGRRISEKRFDLMLVHDYFLQKKTAQGAEKNMCLTGYTFAVEGWIKKRDLAGLKKKCSALFPESLVLNVDPLEGEIPPVAVDNVSLIKPFEAVTNIYGLPSYREVDPTPLLSVFFILYFGICVGDAGYGLTLSAVAYFFYRKFGKKSGSGKLLKLLAYGGIVTFVAGVVTGGWFGVMPTDFPEFLKPARNLLLSIRVIDPVENPIGMLVVALALGVFQVIFGMAVSIYMKIRDGDYLDAILDNGIWIYFLLSLVAWIVQKSGKMFISEHIGFFVTAGAVALVLTQGRKEKKILLKLGKGLLSLYNTVGYLSDVLSYSRILALGMATSIIAMVINMIAMMTKDAVPVLGYVIMLIVLIAGHIFNIAVNVLGSFIHSARLQFVEFFSKFMEGGGVEFKPFKRESKFIEIRSVQHSTLK